MDLVIISTKRKRKRGIDAAERFIASQKKRKRFPFAMGDITDEIPEEIPKGKRSRGKRPTYQRRFYRLRKRNRKCVRCPNVAADDRVHCEACGAKRRKVKS